MVIDVKSRNLLVGCCVDDALAGRFYVLWVAFKCIMLGGLCLIAGWAW
jgi:hypothetical protein